MSQFIGSSLRSNQLNIDAKTLISAVSGQGKNIIFADGEHGSVPDYVNNLLNDPKVMGALSSNGYHMFFCELGDEMQGTIDKFRKGEISADDFAKEMQKGFPLGRPDSFSYYRDSLAPMIANGEKFGMTVVAADVEHGNSINSFEYLLNKYIETAKPTPEQIQMLKDRYNATITAKDGAGREHTMYSERMDVMSELEKVVFPNGVPSQWERLLQDPKVAELIKQKMGETGSDKVIGIYGAHHTLHPSAIQTGLPGGAIKIMVVTDLSEVDQIARQTEWGGQNQFNSPQGPDLIIDKSTGKVYFTPNADPALVKQLQELQIANRPGNPQYELASSGPR